MLLVKSESLVLFTCSEELKNRFAEHPAQRRAQHLMELEIARGLELVRREIDSLRLFPEADQSSDVRESFERAERYHLDFRLGIETSQIFFKKMLGRLVGKSAMIVASHQSQARKLRSRT